MAVAVPSTSFGLAEDGGVVALLQHASRLIDAMWRKAQSDGQPSEVVALGEASQGVHRALISLLQAAE